MVFPPMFYQTVEPGLSGYTSPTNITWATGAIPIEPEESRIELIEAIAALVKEIPKDSSWDNATDHIQDAICSIARSIVEDYEPKSEEEDEE